MSIELKSLWVVKCVLFLCLLFFFCVVGVVFFFHRNKKRSLSLSYHVLLQVKKGGDLEEEKKWGVAQKRKKMHTHTKKNFSRERERETRESPLFPPHLFFYKCALCTIVCI